MLLTIWAFSPSLLWLDASLFGLLDPHTDFGGFVDNVAIMWLVVGAAGLLFRTVQLFFIRSVQTGLVWCTKILTDPFHDLQLYHKSPLYLLRGELIDPMQHVARTGVAADELLDDKARREPAQAGGLSGRPRARRPKRAGEHLAQDRAAHAAIRGGRGRPPPTVGLPSPRRPRRSARRPRGNPRPCSCG